VASHQIQTLGVTLERTGTKEKGGGKRISDFALTYRTGKCLGRGGVKIQKLKEFIGGLVPGTTVTKCGGGMGKRGEAHSQVE